MSVVKLNVRDLLEVKDVATAVGRSTDYVYLAIKSGCLPAQRMGERKWMLLKSDVEQWIEEGMHTRKPQITDASA